MQIDDPHGVGEILPALTPDQQAAEEYEFRTLMCASMVHIMGELLSAAVRSKPRNENLVAVLHHQMGALQKTAVRMNKRYEYLMSKINLGKLS